MASSTVETISNILSGDDYTSTRQVNRALRRINDSIFVKERILTKQYLYTFSSKTTHKLRNIIENNYRKIDASDNGLCQFERIRVDYKVHGMSFIPIFRCAKYNGVPIKWISDKGTFYVTGNSMFDENKKAMFMLDRQNTLLVDVSCCFKTGYMYKFISDTFVKAFAASCKRLDKINISFVDLSDFTPSFNERYDVGHLNEILNDKLHYISKTL